MNLASTHSQVPQRPPTPPPPLVTTAYSKLPDIMTEQIKPMFNGTIPSFFTFLFQLRERRSICHFWASATRLQDIDLLLHFTTVDFEKTLSHLSARWTPTFRARIYKPGSLACAAQLLYQVLTTSIKVNIRRKVSQRLQQFPNLDGDGTAFWLCLTRILFPNSHIFTSSIKTQIRQLSLKLGGDLNEYIMQIEDFIHLLGPYPTDELLPDLFREFKSIPRHYFNKAILDLEQDYYLGRQPDLTCLTLCAKVTEIKRIQEQAQQWDAPIPEDPNIMALRSTIVQQQTALIAQQQVLESLTTRSLRQDRTNGTYDRNNNNNTRNLPRWVREKPQDLDETREFNNRTWYYCSKCRKGTGSWNITHTTGGHITNYYNQHPPMIRNTNNNSHGFRRTFSIDSQESDHSCKRPAVTFEDQRKPSSFKRQVQSQNGQMTRSQMINSLKGARVSLLSCLHNPDSISTNTSSNNGQEMGTGR